MSAFVSRGRRPCMFGLFNKHKIASEVPPANERKSSERFNWQPAVSNCDGNHDESISAVTALNVKVICELAPLIRDRAKYERYQHEAIDLALSIRDEPYRRFAMKQVEGLSRKRHMQ